MTFFESPRFPTNIGIGASGGPEYATEVVELASGYEQRNITQDLPRQRYSVSFVNRPQSEFATLAAFFRMTKGRAHGFRYKDALDFEVSASEGILTAIAGSPSGYYQMFKRYTSGSATEDRKICKPVIGSVLIYENSVLTMSGWTIDFTSGIVYAPGLFGTLTWSGEFDVPVRFASDLMKPAWIPIAENEKLGTWDDIELVELRL